MEKITEQLMVEHREELRKIMLERSEFRVRSAVKRIHSAITVEIEAMTPQEMREFARQLRDWLRENKLT